MTKAQRRFTIALPMGLAFGFLCAYFASSNMPSDFWWGPLMWTIVVSRFVTGFFVACVGVYKVHPLFGFKMKPIMRGAAIGIISSLTLATGVMIPNGTMIPDWKIFWATLIMGGIYGSIIDICATMWGGEGKDLIKK